VLHCLLRCQANFKQLDVVVVSSVPTEHEQRFPQESFAAYMHQVENSEAKITKKT
jgi:hypothetical protein